MTRLNDLSGKVWIKLSKSTWITQSLLAWSNRVPLQFNSMFLIKKQSQLTKQAKSMNDRGLDETLIKLINLFTCKKQRVFDPCLQHSDTMKAALYCKRQFVGIGETQMQCNQLTVCFDQQQGLGHYRLYHQINGNNALTQITNESIDLLLSEIPLFNFKGDHFNYANELNKLKNALYRYREKLKPKAYIALIVADQRYQGQYYCRHSDVIQLLDDKVFKLQGLINVIQDSQALKSYGYPTTYVPNIINKFVIIARKR